MNKSQFMTVIAGTLLCAACITTSHTSPKTLGGYVVGMTFRTSQKLAVIETDDGLAARRFALVAIGSRAPHARNHYGVDSSVLAQHCSQGIRCTPNQDHIAAVVPEAMTLTITRIERRKGVNVWFGHHDDIVVFANSPPELKGIAREVDMTDLSVLMVRDPSADPNEVLYAPDPTLLSQGVQ